MENNTQIWAHRGASAQAPENTLPAFERAVQQGAEGIELDVQMTSDGIVVVSHDVDCRRLTGEPGFVSDLTLAELKRRNFARQHPEAGFVPLPTLAEVFDLLRPTGLMINIELKNDERPVPGLEKTVLDLVVAAKMADRVLLSSFNHASIAAAAALIREIGLAIPCGILYSHRLDAPWAAATRIGAVAIHPRHNLLHASTDIAAAHAAGVSVHPWTVDRPGRLKHLIDCGADAVITNRPDLALHIRAKRMAARPLNG